MNNKQVQILIKHITLILLVIIYSQGIVSAQLSPGDLSEPHSHLEGISNCTKCHVIGNKISGEKCLSCHTEIQQRIALQKGYHASSEVRGKDCFSCHREHNGRNFQLVRLDISKFDHNLTGFSLSAPHTVLECKKCHYAGMITDQIIKAKKFTYLGLKTECLSCHEDYHRQTLSSSCLSCHNPEKFSPASRFDHSEARFKLLGKHKNTDCFKCHRVETINGMKFQEFRGVVYTSCASCHKDPHQNNFGKNCSQCHSEESFQVLKRVYDFDHNKTNFRLEDKHLAVDCKTCHKGKFTDPLKHDRCMDCHADYHEGQFSKNEVSPDCSQCHSFKGFDRFSYSTEQHMQGAFPLKGSHAAVPCLECHKKQEKWSFRGIGLNCKDCHADIHQTFIQTKYYPEGNCRICHSEEGWGNVTFYHSKTGFSLTGAHAQQKCAVCHITRGPGGSIAQRFKGLPLECSGCHTDNHQGQFSTDGRENCTNCHVTENWKPAKFDHNKTNFRLEGKHIAVPCAGCHKLKDTGTSKFTLYKINDLRCESCHSY